MKFGPSQAFCGWDFPHSAVISFFFWYVQILILYIHTKHLLSFFISCVFQFSPCKSVQQIIWGKLKMQCNACQNWCTGKKNWLFLLHWTIDYFLVIRTSEILTQYSFQIWIFSLLMLLFLKLKITLHYLSAETKTVQGHFASPLTHSMNEAVQSRVLLNLDQNFSLSIFHDALTMGLKCKAWFKCCAELLCFYVQVSIVLHLFVVLFMLLITINGLLYKCLIQWYWWFNSIFIAWIFFLLYSEACIVGIYSVALYKSCTHTCDKGFCLVLAMKNIAIHCLWMASFFQLSHSQV